MLHIIYTQIFSGLLSLSETINAVKTGLEKTTLNVNFLTFSVKMLLFHKPMKKIVFLKLTIENYSSLSKKFGHT